MQVGDLVELSAYARRLKMFRSWHKRVGIVVEIKHFDAISVQWCGYNAVDSLCRKDLRHAK